MRPPQLSSCLQLPGSVEQRWEIPVPLRTLFFRALALFPPLSLHPSDLSFFDFPFVRRDEDLFFLASARRFSFFAPFFSRSAEACRDSFLLLRVVLFKARRALLLLPLRSLQTPPLCAPPTPPTVGTSLRPKTFPAVPVSALFHQRFFFHLSPPQGKYGPFAANRVRSPETLFKK